jgi:cytochrome c553
MKKLVLAALLTLGLSGMVQAQGDAVAGEGKTVVCQACHGANGNDSILPDVPKLGGQNEKYLLKQMQDIKSGARMAPLMTGMLNILNDQDMADVAAFFASQDAPRGAATEESLALGASLYRAGNADIGAAACSACHAPTGVGNPAAGYPALGGQDVAYTELQLKAFRSGERQNDTAEEMRSITARLNDAEITALASYVSGLGSP